MFDVSILMYNSPVDPGRLEFLAPLYREDKRGLERWRVMGPRSRIQRRIEARLNSKAAQKSKPLPVQRTKAGTFAGRRQLPALPGGGAKPPGCESGASPATANSREDVRRGVGGKSAPTPPAPPVDHLAPPPRRRAPGQAPPPLLAGREANARSLPLPSACGEGGEGGRRALACCVLAYVAGVRLRPSRRSPVAAAAVAALSLRRPPPKGGWGRAKPPLLLPGCRECTSAA